MKTSLAKTVRWLLPRSAKMHLTLFEERAALTTSGWFRSRREGMPVDMGGRPLPWYSYPAIRFLDERVPADAKVFEFGMGNSTLWWSGRAARVASVESDEGWFEKITPKMPPNVTALLHPVDSDNYVGAAGALGQTIDILIIDGRRRVECCEASIDLVTERGIVVWDNAERERYAAGQAMLIARGFRRLDMWGMGPLNTYEWLTTIFYRDGNILGI